MMQTDELIRNAMKGGGGMLDGKSFFVVEGHVEKNEFRVLSLQEAYIENYVSFVFQIDHRFIMLGIFNTAEAADEFIQMVRTIGRDEAGNRIG